MEDDHIADREYFDYLDDQPVSCMISMNKTRLIVNIDELQSLYPNRYKKLLTEYREQTIFSKALANTVRDIDKNYYHLNNYKFHVGFTGQSLIHRSPREITSSLLGQLVCVFGTCIKIGSISVSLERSVHYCPAKNTFLYTNYTPSSKYIPTRDFDGNSLVMQFGHSSYVNYQALTLQELPDRVPTGQRPRSVEVVCIGDLVDKCKPGDRVTIFGSYRIIPPDNRNGNEICIFSTNILATNIIPLIDENVNAIEISSNDIKECRKLAATHGVIDLLTHSIAPSISGFTEIKRGILCLLLGGNEIISEDSKMRIRGNINILLIGDPSMAKSQFLRYVTSVAQNAVKVTGRMSSGVGLTASIGSRENSKDMCLQPGAAVTADRGVLCIDEFDKMTDADRTTLHEVMEQGQVTITKSGAHETLNARCSTLAAANPLKGCYDPEIPLMKNIWIQDSLLSRFDLIFPMIDWIDVNKDRVIAYDVAYAHAYRAPGECDGDVMSDKLHGDQTTYKEPPMYETWPVAGSSKKLLSHHFVRKYIAIARYTRPKLTDLTAQMIEHEYARIRQLKGIQTQPITTRALYSLIRLATAHAKARLSHTIDECDALGAFELFAFALQNKTIASADVDQLK